MTIFCWNFHLNQAILFLNIHNYHDNILQVWISTFIKQLQLSLSFICKEYDFQINSIKNQDYKISLNKKVLLREHKRHTARSVASPRPGGTYLGWGVLTLGYPFPHADLARWYLPWLGVPTLGYPLPHLDLARVGTPPPQWTDKQSETITFPFFGCGR